MKQSSGQQVSIAAPHLDSVPGLGSDALHGQDDLEGVRMMLCFQDDPGLCQDDEIPPSYGSSRFSLRGLAIPTF